MNVEEFAKIEKINELMYFAFVAKNDLASWKKIVNYNIFHIPKYGNGKIIEFRDVKKHDLEIIIKFDEQDDKKKFESTSFVKGLFKFSDDYAFDEDMCQKINFVKGKVEKEKINLKNKQEQLRKELEYKRKYEEERIERHAAIERQKQKEAQEKEEFEKLKEKYKVSYRKETSLLSKLYLNLLKINEREVLNNEEIEWLEKQRLFFPLSCYYLNKNGDFWDLIHASKYLRKSNYCSESLNVLIKAEPKDNYERSVILTVKGATYRKMGELDSAEKNAVESIELGFKKPHPYNLLGAIYFQKGKFEEGLEYFNTAISLGSKQKEIMSEIKEVLEDQTQEGRALIAKYLLEKDPQRFKWAEYYLIN